MSNGVPDKATRPLRLQAGTTETEVRDFLRQQIESGEELAQSSTRYANLTVAERWKENAERWRSYVAAGLDRHFEDDWPAKEFLQSSDFGAKTRLFTPYELLQHLDARGKTAMTGGLSVLRSFHEGLDFAVAGQAKERGSAPGLWPGWHKLVNEPNPWVLATVTGVLATVIAGIILALFAAG